MENNNTHKQNISARTRLPKGSISSTTNMAITWNEVSTSRLVLRRLQTSDGQAIFAVHGDPATNLYNPRGPHLDIATSEEMLRDCLQHWDAYGFGIWAGALATLSYNPQLVHEEQIIGFGGVEHFEWRERDVLNLYYRFAPGAWGKGYATEMAQAAVHLARTYLPQYPVVARIRAKNIPSLRTAERAGLIRRPDLDTEHLAFVLGW